MTNFIQFLKENIRYLLAVLANIFALIASIWWALDSNWETEKPIEIEPIVTCIALTATLLGLNFVNDKLSRPHLKVKLSISMAQHPEYGFSHGINVRVENHSLFKAFIDNFQVKLPEQNGVFQFLHEGFTREPLPKISIEPGQAFSFNIVKRNLTNAPIDAEKYGEFIVKTDVGHKFIVPAKIFQDHFRILMQHET